MIKAELVNYMGSDLTVVNAARVSFKKESNWEEGELNAKDTRLVRYLAEHEHQTPFGHCFATFHVAAPIFVARQLVKHKFLRINEVSRRYVNDDPEFYHPPKLRSILETYANKLPTNEYWGTTPKCSEIVSER